MDCTNLTPAASEASRPSPVMAPVPLTDMLAAARRAQNHALMKIEDLGLQWGAKQLIESANPSAVAIVLQVLCAALEQVRQTFDQHGLSRYRLACHAVRDMLVMLCRIKTPPGNKEAFLGLITEAYGRRMTVREEQAVLHAYRIRMENQSDAFLSGNQQKFMRRGWARERKIKPICCRGSAVVQPRLRPLCWSEFPVFLLAKASDGEGNFENAEDFSYFIQTPAERLSF